MKKVIFGLIVTIMFSNFSFAQNIKEIGNDKEFETYIMQSINLNKNLNKEFLTKTFNDKQIDENEVEYIYKVFNSSGLKSVTSTATFTRFHSPLISFDSM